MTCLIGGSLELIDEFVGKVKKFCKPAGAVFILEEQQQLEAVKKSLRLTVTQGHQDVYKRQDWKLSSSGSPCFGGIYSSASFKGCRIPGYYKATH